MAGVPGSSKTVRPGTPECRQTLPRLCLEKHVLDIVVEHRPPPLCAAELGRGPRPVSVRQRKVFMNQLDGYGARTHRRRDAVGGTVSNVADRKDARDAGLEVQRRAL